MSIESTGQGTAVPAPSRMPDTISVSSRVVTIASLLLAIGAILSLVIVSTIKSADTLSVVALALTVVTFGAQLVQVIGQNIVSSSQYHQMLDINSRSQEALAEIRVATGDSMLRRDQHFERLLESVVPSALAESIAKEPSISTEINIDDLSARVLKSALSQFSGAGGYGAGAGELPLPDGRINTDGLLAQRPLALSTLRSLPASRQLALWKEMTTHLDQLRDFGDERLVEWIRRTTPTDS